MLNSIVLDTTRITKMIEYTRELNDIMNKLHILGDIEKGDKIGKTLDKYYIFKEEKTQYIKRWWFNEDRKSTFQYLDEDFKAFFKICTAFNNKPPNLLDNIPHIIIGLYNLKHSYKNDTDDGAIKLSCKIDSIILTLIDIKNEINQCTNIKTIIPIQKNC